MNKKYILKIILFLLIKAMKFILIFLSILSYSIQIDSSINDFTYAKFFQLINERYIICTGKGIYLYDSQLNNRLSEKIFDNAINIGWDEKYGGIVYFKDAGDKPVEAYEHDMKLWWPHNEGIVASLLLFKVTGKQQYADWFEKLTKYSFEHFSDREFGEWYGYLRRDGQPTEPPCKGCTYKGPFHVLRCLASVIRIFDDKDF